MSGLDLDAIEARYESVSVYAAVGLALGGGVAVLSRAAEAAARSASDVPTLVAALRRVEALITEAHDEYLSAASEARYLEQSSRERAEWSANAAVAAEWRDRITAALNASPIAAPAKEIA